MLDFYLKLLTKHGPPGAASNGFDENLTLFNPGKRGNRLWAWWRTIPSSSEKQDAAKAVINQATNKDHLALVAAREGWVNVSPETRTSLYMNEEYAKVPFVKMTIGSINPAEPTAPSVQPVPYIGVQFLAPCGIRGPGKLCWRDLLGGPCRSKNLKAQLGGRRNESFWQHPVTHAGSAFGPVAADLDGRPAGNDAVFFVSLLPSAVA